MLHLPKYSRVLSTGITGIIGFDFNSVLWGDIRRTKQAEAAAKYSEELRTEAQQASSFIYHLKRFNNWVKATVGDSSSYCVAKASSSGRVTNETVYVTVCSSVFFILVDFLSRASRRPQVAYDHLTLNGL